MAGPNLPTTITSGVTTGHVAHTQAIHNIVNRFDTAIGTANSGNVLAWNGSVYAPAAPAATSGVPMAVESAAGVATGNTGTTNRNNFNTWAAANVGVPIFFRAGVYDFSGGSGQSVLEPKGSMFGAGPGVTVLRFPESEFGNVYYRNVSNITIADLEIRGTGTSTPFSANNGAYNSVGLNTPWSNHLTFDNVQFLTARNVYVSGSANIGIMHTNGCENIVTQGCRVRGTTRDGIHYTQSSRIACVGNVVMDTGDDCIAVIAYNADTTRPTKVSIVGNVVTNLRARGITVEGALTVTVAGNSVGPVAGHGILLNSIGSVTTDTWGNQNVTVVGNTIDDAGVDGIHINGKTATMLVANNVINSAAGHGIAVLRGRVVLDGNVIDDAGANGIFLTQNGAGMDQTVIRDNTVRRANFRGIYTQAAGRLLIQNNVVQEPNQAATAPQGILIEQGASHVVTGNRIDATNSTRTTSAITLYQVTGALVALNYQTASGTLLTNDQSTGIVTA